MKALMKVFAAVLILATIALCFSSCGSPGKELTGKWVYVEGELDIEGVWNDLEIRDKTQYNIWGEKLYETEGQGSIEFKKDGSYCFDNGDDFVSQNYTVHDGGIVVMFNEGINNTFIYDVHGGTLTLNKGNEEAVFKKGRGASDYSAGMVTCIIITMLLLLGLPLILVKSAAKKRNVSDGSDTYTDTPIYNKTVPDNTSHGTSYCRFCGEIIPSNALFCGFCGNKRDDA